MMTTSGLRSDTEHARRELRVGFGELARDGRSQEMECLGGGRRCVRHDVWRVVVETRVLGDLGGGMARVHAREPEAAAVAIEGEQAAIGDEGNGPTAAVDVA